jgi:hypothetical protein
MILKKGLSFLLKPVTILVVYVVLAVIVSIQSIGLGSHKFEQRWVGNGNDIMTAPEIVKQFQGKSYTEYNNYIVFKNSFYHLLACKDLYTIYPDAQWDLYKYSPSFSLFMGLIAWMPDWLGLMLWNLINALVLFFAIYKLPFTDKHKAFALWFILVSLITSLQASQSNALLAGLMIVAYNCLRNSKSFWALFWLTAACFIKPYAAIGFCLFLFYPGKIKFMLYGLLSVTLLFALPLLVTSFSSLLFQYKSWLHLISADQSASYGLSIIGLLHSMFGIVHVKNEVMVFGIVLFLLPFARTKLYGEQRFQLYTLASMLIWLVLFNHKAETPTFIIPIAGTAIWFFADKYKLSNLILLLLVFVCVSLSTTDLFPKQVKYLFFKVYYMPVLSLLVLWVTITVELLTMHKKALNAAAE